MSTSNTLPFDIDLDNPVQKYSFEFLSFGMMTDQTKNKKDKRQIKNAFRDYVYNLYKNDNKRLLYDVLEFGKQLKKDKISELFYKDFSLALKQKEDSEKEVF